ncbi:MAG: DUF3455 domain-containing protein [Betaproteobacteria bacterium]|nr:DUF3455 domain-containing protein [Betaproteobacteria bacterium]
MQEIVSAATATIIGLAAAGVPASYAADATPSVPEAIRITVPVEHLFDYRITGVQIYVCATKGDAKDAQVEWQFKSPEGSIIGADGEVIGRHYAGPAWALSDGSKVTAEVAGRAAAPDAKNIPWLLLKATSTAGSGKLARVSFIQRLQTEGGTAPREGCDATNVGSEHRSAYSARYHFYADRNSAGAK